MAVVSSTAGTASLVAREQAFVREAAHRGLDVVVHRAGPTGYATGSAAARALLAGADRPAAAFCVTDLMACGFMDAARHEFGLRIPDDLCVIGFDDIEQAGWAAYQLTTFRQPIPEFTARILEAIEGRTEEQAGPVQAQPVWRRSVRAVSGPVATA